MAWTAEDVATAKAALITALETGQQVTFGGRSYTSHNLEALRAIVADMERQSSSSSQRYRFAATSKGFRDCSSSD